MRPVYCCEHNPCPQRPRFFLGRFFERPWVCPQCDAFWVTRYKRDYVDEGLWVWEKTATKPQEDNS